MKTLLLCSYRTSDHSEYPLGLARDANGDTLIDRRILELRQLGLDAVCVLAGPTADQQLRESRLMERAELVFDTADNCSLISNAQAGAFVLEGEAAFLMPIEIPPPPPEIWAFLRNEYGKAGFATPFSFLQTISQGAPCHFGLPLLVTRQGGKMLRESNQLRSLIDPRLLTLQLEYAAQATLEPAGQAL